MMAMLTTDIVSAGAKQNTPIIAKPPRKGINDRYRQP
jgi:hypothetical protein